MITILRVQRSPFPDLLGFDNTLLGVCFEKFRERKPVVSKETVGSFQLLSI